jgi:phosphonopyruvate decarboxylase
MLPCQAFYQALQDVGVRVFAGVPDSLLKDFCAYVSDHAPESAHTITANEGAAIALVCGHHLATGELGLVYLQNSGQGNIINPLTSLASRNVYGIPMLLLIGWRGEPGTNDEPQHVQQGAVTLDLLEAIGVEYSVLPNEIDAAISTLSQAADKALASSSPYAIIVRKGSFLPYPLRKQVPNSYGMKREDAIQLVAAGLDEDTTVVSTTGMASRELYEYRVAQQQDTGRDFLTVGSMGHASQIALGIALARPDRQVCCLDGDGALLMHMGSMAIIGTRKPANFLHVVINNAAHDSVGGQPTVGFDIDMLALARACDYAHAERADDPETLSRKLAEIRALSGPSLLEIRTNRGARSDLGRPTTSPSQNKDAFMRRLRS